MNHDSRDSGHLGQLNTYLRVKKSFYWFRLRNCVYNYVSTCAKCKTNKKPHRRRPAGLGQYHAGAPMDRVMIDVLGPLSRTPRGNSIILMLIDQFTKWVECYPLPDQSAELIAKTLVDEFFSRFGLPLEIYTDQGSNFVGNLFTNLCLFCRLLKLELLVIGLVLMVRLSVWIVKFCRWSDVFVKAISKTGMFIYLKLQERCARLSAAALGLLITN